MNIKLLTSAILISSVMLMTGCGKGGDKAGGGKSGGMSKQAKCEAVIDYSQKMAKAKSPNAPAMPAAARTAAVNACAQNDDKTVEQMYSAVKAAK